MPSVAGGTPGQDLPTIQKAYRNPPRNAAAAIAAYSLLTLPAFKKKTVHLKNGPKHIPVALQQLQHTVQRVTWFSAFAARSSQ